MSKSLVSGCGVKIEVGSLSVAHRKVHDTSVYAIHGTWINKEGHCKDAYVTKDGELIASSLYKLAPEVQGNITFLTKESAKQALEELKKGNNVMTKQQLKSGMTVEVANGTKYLIILGTQHCGDVIMRDGGFIGLDKYRDDLIYVRSNKYEREWDIVKVYDMPTAYSKTLSTVGKCVWTRPEPTKEVTMADIEAKFGCKVKIVK